MSFDMSRLSDQAGLSKLAKTVAKTEDRSPLWGNQTSSPPVILIGTTTKEAMFDMRRFAAATAVVLTGCSMSADSKLAEQAVPLFHQMLDAGQFEAIYDSSAEDLKKVSTKENFTAFVDAVHRKLGTTKSSKQVGWNVNSRVSVTIVTLNYATTFSEGDATEQFVYRVEDKKALLVGYHISSNALILK